MLNHLWGLDDKEAYEEKKEAKEGGTLKESGKETRRSKSSFKIASSSLPHVLTCSAAAHCNNNKKTHHGVLNNASGSIM